MKRKLTHSLIFLGEKPHTSKFQVGEFWGLVVLFLVTPLCNPVEPDFQGKDGDPFKGQVWLVSSKALVCGAKGPFKHKTGTHRSSVSDMALLELQNT